jgi:hypothetical protein
MNDTLFYAILSMDAYNRGGGAGLELPSAAADGLGTATLAADRALRNPSAVVNGFRKSSTHPTGWRRPLMRRVNNSGATIAHSGPLHCHQAELC